MTLCSELEVDQFHGKVMYESYANTYIAMIFFVTGAAVYRLDFSCFGSQRRAEDWLVDKLVYPEFLLLTSNKTFN